MLKAKEFELRTNHKKKPKETEMTSKDNSRKSWFVKIKPTLIGFALTLFVAMFALIHIYKIVQPQITEKLDPIINKTANRKKTLC